jgi:dolichyl-phosphate-mannose--protein O-mannosyl transferase
MGRPMTKTNLRWGNQANATDPLLEAPGSLVAAAFLSAYLIAWWPFMAVCFVMYVLTAAATAFMVLLCLPCILWRRVRRQHDSHHVAAGPRATPTP